MYRGLIVVVMGSLGVLGGCAGSRVAIPEVDLSIRPVSTPGTVVVEKPAGGTPVGAAKEGGS
nr:MAG: hypothetical protein [Microvirus sp.]